MALSITQRFSSSSGATAGASFTFSPGTNTTVGTKLVLAVSSASSKVVTSVTDDTGANSWTVDKTNVDAGGRAVSFISCQVVGQIKTTNVITVNLSPTTSTNYDAWLLEIGGAKVGSAFDTFGTGTGTTTTAISAGPTATLAQAAEIGIAVFKWSSSGPTWTPTAPWITTGLTAKLTSAASVIEYQIVNATTALTAAGTAGGNVNFGGLLVTYEAITPPVNTVAPVVSGTTTVGQTLSSTAGTWTDDGTGVKTYQWQRDNHGGGTYSNIGSATSSTYVLVDADDGCNMRCVVTDTDGQGATSANSNSVGTVVEPAPVNTVAPLVSGSAPVGSVLSVTTGTWNNMGGYLPAFAYQWTRAGSNIAAATSSSYTTVSADAGHAVGCTVTATNTGGNASQASSNTITVTSSGGTTTMITAVGSSEGSLLLQKRAKLRPLVKPPYT